MSPGLPWWLSSEKSTCNSRDTGLIPGLGRVPLEKEMAAHSNILPWEISGTEEPGRLQSMGSQKNWIQLGNLITCLLGLLIQNSSLSYFSFLAICCLKTLVIFLQTSHVLDLSDNISMVCFIFFCSIFYNWRQHAFNLRTFLPQHCVKLNF